MATAKYSSLSKGQHWLAPKPMRHSINMEAYLSNALAYRRGIRAKCKHIYRISENIFYLQTVELFSFDESSFRGICP